MDVDVGGDSDTNEHMVIRAVSPTFIIQLDSDVSCIVLLLLKNRSLASVFNLKMYATFAMDISADIEETFGRIDGLGCA